MNAELAFGNQPRITHKTYLLREIKMRIDVARDFKNGVGVVAFSEQRSEHRLVEVTKLPPALHNMLEFDFDDGDMASNEVKDNPVRLTPTYALMPARSESKPHPWEIKLRD